MLYFMLEEENYKVIERHNVNKLDELLLILDNFVYNGSNGGMPLFVKC